MKQRLISWFSCGAASAYASYLALRDPQYTDLERELVYCRVREETDDNLRFLLDYEEAIRHPIKIIEDEKYGGSVLNVIASTKFIKGPTGAPCTRILKKEVRKKYQRHDDVQVFGYTAEEENRADRFIDSNNEVNAVFPLLEKGITKAECLEFVSDMRIQLPRMYRLGYANNNCVGCVKGGMGYWNAIRVDFPERFHEMAELERVVGHSINKGPEGPVFLDELEPNRGNFHRDMPADCGFSCEWQQGELEI